MDAHLFRRFCEAAEPLLLGSRIEKLQEAGPGLLVLSLYGNGGKRQFCLRHDRKEPFCFFAGSRLTSGAAPTAAVMRLRKYAVGRRIAALVPQFCQRRLWLLLSGTAEKQGGAIPAGTALWLLLDLRDGASLHFQRQETDAQADPPLSPEPDAPAWPGPAQLPEALAHWRDWPVLSPALRRSLAHMEEADQWALMEDLRAGGGDVFLYTEAGAPDAVRAVAAWPLPPELRAGLEEESGDEALALVERAAASLVLGRLAEAAGAARAKPVERRLRKIAKLLEKLDMEEGRLKAMIRRQEDALALSANLWRWPADFRAEVVELAADREEAGAPRRIRLDGRHTVRANMERLFHAARRGKRGLELLAPRRAALLEEAESLRQALGGAGPALPADAGEGAPGPAPVASARLLPRELPRRVQAFVSEDGFLLLRGRDARGNQAVLRKAAPGDIWLHAEGGPGAHVLIRRAHAGQEVPERTLEQAGCLAACKSWRRDAASARILYAEARHVRPLRGAAPGTVRMDKILATREVAVDPELENRLVHS
ncbi:NFACT RNA binding domain-containing protein [Desulfovibrio sp.]|uniref:NFACT RNA binding domain-containing protein n=1 Tax=Desulfovibrio sp. TaxID=885 RepID=UPI0023D22183|nr:NFACT RNA binding domain-containing protein [Desulfovibrio sp.]MDE7242126.1 NFACT RNA binding domain-containing protein [Desulfovibrio sp.]